MLFDTTFLVQVDRKDADAISLAKLLEPKGISAFISSITVSEIMAGALLRHDPKEAMENARMVLAQFDWKDLDGGIALKAGELLAWQINGGKRISYQDTAIAATALELGADLIVTENRNHFSVFPETKGIVVTAREALKLLNA